jgi:rubrerythrin
VARFFRAAAEAETVHARNHFGAMDGVVQRDNLTAHRWGALRVYQDVSTVHGGSNRTATQLFNPANEVEQPPVL